MKPEKSRKPKPAKRACPDDPLGHRTGKTDWSKPPIKGLPFALKKWPSLEDMTREQMREQSHENAKILKWMFGLPLDYKPPRDATIMGILSDLSEPGDDAVEMVKRARAM